MKTATSGAVPALMEAWRRERWPRSKKTLREAIVKCRKAAVEAVGGIARFVPSGSTVLINANTAFKHRGSIVEPDVLLAIASWDSKAARDAMEEAGDERVAAIIRAQAEFVDVKVVGEFEDPEWVVLPQR